MSFNENEKTDGICDNMDQKDRVNIEEAFVNVGCVKKELDEEELEEKKYKITLTYENTFGENSIAQKNDEDSLIDHSRSDVKIETVKLENVKEENEDQKPIEQIYLEIIQCHYCKVWLEKQEHLESHMQECTENYDRLSTSILDFQRKNVDQGDETSNDGNTTEKEHKCSEYSYQTNDEGNSKQHLNSNLSKANSITIEKKYKCSKCFYQTNYKSNFNGHLNTHSDVTPFQCKVCEKYFSKKFNLKLHMQQHLNTSKKTYSCSECAYQTNIKHSYKSHLNTHLEVTPFQCELCKKYFNKKFSLKLHMQQQHLNTSKKTYRCSECAYQTNYKENLKSHLNTHLDATSFQCGVCQKYFSKKYNLQQHMQRQHLNTIEKEYKCPECSYETNYKGNFESHLNTHSDVTPFQCDICKKYFNQKSCLKQHIQRHHTTEDVNYKSKLKEDHSKHSDVRRFQCGVCKKYLKHESSLKSHSNLHSGIKAFECNVCKRSYTEKRSLNRHVKTQHSS